MRWVSAIESVRTGEPSLLAIIETLCAVTASFAIGVIWETWWHLWVAATVAPLMLLRTEASIRIGWYAFRRLRRLRQRVNAKALGLLLFPAYFILAPAFVGDIFVAVGLVFLLWGLTITLFMYIPAVWGRLTAQPLYSLSRRCSPDDCHSVVIAARRGSEARATRRSICMGVGVGDGHRALAGHLISYHDSVEKYSGAFETFAAYEITGRSQSCAFNSLFVQAWIYLSVRKNRFFLGSSVGGMGQ
jgi:hypothetical protein